MFKVILFFATACTAPLMANAQANELRYKANGFHAEFFEPDEPSGRALIVLGGAEGGNEFGNLMAPYFQANGYHVMSLAYFRADGLHDQLEEVPVEMVGRAISWIQSNRAGKINRIGMIGGSKGAELALVSAALLQNIDALVLISPSSVVWQSINEQSWDSEASSWTFKETSLPFLRYDFSRGVQNIRDFYSAAIDSREDNSVVIAAENVECPILMLSGSQDNLWPSETMAEMIVSRLQSKAFPHTVDHVNYEKAGHLLIHAAAFDDSAEWPDKGAFEALGGSVSQFEEIALDSLQRITDFLEREL